jgi:hypothetical protein
MILNSTSLITYSSLASAKLTATVVYLHNTSSPGTLRIPSLNPLMNKAAHPDLKAFNDKGIEAQDLFMSILRDLNPYAEELLQPEFFRFLDLPIEIR